MSVQGDEHPKLKEFIEGIISRESRILESNIETVNTRFAGKVETLEQRIEVIHTRYKERIETIRNEIQAVRETAQAVLVTTQKHLEELNNAATKRSEMERVDRQQYVQAGRYDAWTANVERELKGAASAEAVRQAIEDLRRAHDELSKDFKTLSNLQMTTGGELSANRMTRQLNNWIPAAIISAIISVVVFVLSRLIR